MTNIHTLDSLRESSSNINNLSQIVSDGTQLLPVLKLRASKSEINGVQSSLDKVVEEHIKYMEENGSSSISESFPDLYPASIEEEVTVTSLFDIIKNIYNSILKSEVDIDENNIETITTLIRNDPSCYAPGGLSEEIKEALNTVVSDLNNGINSNNLKPLGQFGDITLNELILKGQNLDFSFLINNHEILVYPLKLLPAGLVYGTIVRLFMKHCDDYNSIIKERDLIFRTRLLRIRRINPLGATTLAITAPIATLLFLKLGTMSIFDGIKIGAITPPSVTHQGNLVNEVLLNYIPLFTIFAKHKQKKKNLFFKLFILTIFIILCVGLYKYNIFTFINKDIIIYLIYYIWFLILIFTIVYNSIGYFILLIKNEIDIDLNKIRIKFIRNTIENFIVIRNKTKDKEKLKKYFISHLYLSFFVIILSGILILI